MKGKITNIETMGSADGPGVRLVIFLAGCKLRCLYCHNPETWIMENYKTEISSEEVLNTYKKYSVYYGQNGGVTFSGGEPLLQSEFLLETIKLLKQNNIHVALDTAGVTDENYDEILDLADLVILDIKAVEEQKYFDITGKKMEKFNQFLQNCIKKQKKLWFRQVIVPGINDTEESVLKLKEFTKNIPNVERIELLPYHSMGAVKYKELNIPYRLENTENMDKEKCKVLEKLLKN